MLFASDTDELLAQRLLDLVAGGLEVEAAADKAGCCTRFANKVIGLDLEHRRRLDTLRCTASSWLPYPIDSKSK